MADYMRVNGMIIIWMEWEHTLGMMAECIRECIRMTRNMAMEYMFGVMVADMMEIG